ncbi:MAG: dihydroxyacetone kinase operon transcriptional regulator DhaR [Psychromonas sp.]
MKYRFSINEDIWRLFVSSKADDTIVPEMDPHLFEVWSRCRRQQKHDHWSLPHSAKGVTFSSIQKSKSEFLNIAVPAIEDIYEYLEDNNCALLVSDETGCTLNFIATQEMRTLLADLGIQEGAYWREGIMGNNAISSAMKLAKATKTVGFEHYKQALHLFAIYAAPVFDSAGTVHGGVALVLPVEKASSTALGLIHSAARDIASQIHAESMLTESNQHLSEVNVLLEGVDEGVIAWDSSGKIHYLNQKGSTLLGLKKSDLGSKINSALTLPHQVQQAIKRGKALDMVETTVDSKGKLISLVLSLKIVKNSQNEIERYIALLYPLKHIRDLVHQHFGNLARLTFDDITAVSESMLRVVQQARHASKGRGPVLLHGEDGLSKSHLAQAIHNASSRHGQPFIAINCQAIPKELMATEFLGSVTVFDGDRASPSKFELANGGTLFLDHVENLSSEVQAALLHLLKTGLLNLMTRHIVPLDVRIIATSNINLEQYVTEKHFGLQLLLELQTFDIHVPPLRDRIEDIPTLVKSKLAYLEGEKKRSFAISEDTMSLLMQYHWPGNNRELRNVIERAANFSDSGEIRIKDMPDSIFSTTDATSSDKNPLLSNNLLNAEKNTILRSAKHCRGRTSEMCKDLQVSRTTLWRKLKTHNIDVSDYK